MKQLMSFITLCVSLITAGAYAMDDSLLIQALNDIKKQQKRIAHQEHLACMTNALDAASQDPENICSLPRRLDRISNLFDWGIKGKPNIKIYMSNDAAPQVTLVSVTPEFRDNVFDLCIRYSMASWFEKYFIRQEVRQLQKQLEQDISSRSILLHWPAHTNSMPKNERSITPEEQDFSLAHECAHIHLGHEAEITKGLAAIVSKEAAALLEREDQDALSRSREFDADEQAARVLGSIIGGTSYFARINQKESFSHPSCAARIAHLKEIAQKFNLRQ